MSPVTVVGALAASYLLGSLPFSYWIARSRGIDVRSVGSGNVGATNVMRAAGRGAGVLALVLDALKGTAAAYVGVWLAPHAPAAAQAAIPGLCALAAIVGHLFPIWLGFRGGKGVATGVGAFAPVAPLALGLGLVSFVLVVLTTRYVSLGSLVGAAVVAVAAPLTGTPREGSLVIAMAVALIIARHHSNIRRLLSGSERRVGRDHGGQA